MKKVYYSNEEMKYVNFYIPTKYIDMIDSLSCEYADGNRTQMLIKLIEQEYGNALEQKSIAQGLKGYE